MRRDLLPIVRQALADRYVVEREIGRGGAARVFLARTVSGEEPVALKILHPELAVTTTAERFLREISFTARLDHPNIAHLLDSGERDWLVYFVMPLIEGPTLRFVLDHARRLSVDDTLRVAHDLLAALAHAHAHGIVHRDVKPENVLVARTGAVLVDFGIARAIDVSAGEALTRSGVAVGTSSYMSPEQIGGNRFLDHRCDIYSVGCVVFECLAGRPPFGSGNDVMVLQRHLTEEPPDVRRFRPDTPAALAESITRALRKSPDERWPTASAMADAIAAVPTA